MQRIPTHRQPTPPGEMLLEEFMKPLGLTQGELAGRLGMDCAELDQLIGGRRAITSDIAQRLAEALGTTPQFWLNVPVRPAG